MKKLTIILSLFLLLLSGIECLSQSRYISETTKKVVFARDGGKCLCCGSTTNLEFDHIMPYSCGGKGDALNIQLLCQRCNRSKSNSCYCKVHNKKVGINCCDGNTSVTNSSKSTSTTKNYETTSTRCTGTTKSGQRCKNMTRNSNGRCHLH